jgi:hypothetical protein
LLPNQENFQNDFGSVTVDSDLGTLRNYLADWNSREAAATMLERLIYYQIRQGFWDKSAVRTHDVDSQKLIAAQQSLELAQRSLVVNLGQFESLHKDYTQKVQELDEFMAGKKREFKVMEQHLSTASGNNESISRMAGEATNSNTRIEGLLATIEEKTQTVTDHIAGYQVVFDKFSADSSKLKLRLEESIKNSEASQVKSKEACDFVDSKKEEIIRLTGMAADGALGSKFDQRYIKLETGISIWMLAVPIVTVVSIIWAVVVFTCLEAHTDNQWANLLINVLKTSPAFILMGFVFSQYSKERNLQEEYAFKSAVAMTLTAYSSMLEKGDEETNKSRQDMLLKSIQQVYMQPRLYPDKPDRIYSANGKHLKAAIITLTEAVKNIKN